jgi:dihydroorotate dehydrogenase
MIYRSLLRPLLFTLKAEPAHNFALRGARLLASSRTLSTLVHKTLTRPQSCPVRVMGLDFPNPIGLAGGMDKNGVAPLAWWAFGFGFVELGTVTPVAQDGNDKPRMFRYAGERAIVNRMGFNNLGAETLASRLADQTARGLRPQFPIGISVGKNKLVEGDAIPGDFARAAASVVDHADFLTVNVSSPNTPGLRALQNAADLAKIVRAVMAVAKGKPVLVKVAPELADDDLRAVLDAALTEGAAGFIATNTLSTANKPQYETGGLSGGPLREIAVRKVAEIRAHIGDNPALIGCGGITDVLTARAMLAAGANLVQIYTALVYEGPFLPAKITRRLVATA